MNDAELAESLVDRFRVDLLFPIEDTAAITSFVAAHDYLHWPSFSKTLFHEAWQHIPARAAFVDVYHAARALREARRRKRKMLMPSWDEGDPLALLLLAMLGGYPAPSSEVPNYKEMLARILGVEDAAIQSGAPVAAELWTRLTPSRLTTVDLDADETGPDHGVYVGTTDNFDDMVNFWNIRAAGAELVFYDPAHRERLSAVLDAHRSWLDKAPARPWQGDGTISIYRREDLRETPPPAELGKVLAHSVSAGSWNGLNIKPTSPYWVERPVLGSVDESEGRQTLTFALPEKPVHDHPQLSQQQLAASIRGGDPWTLGGTATFFPPYVPELNEYYGRNLHFDYARVRAEPGSIWNSVGFLTTVSDADVTLRALNSIELVSKLFERFGIKAATNRPGRVTSRLIAQMDGLQGCRVFKIEGVRKLITEYKPDQSFTRSGAVVTIGNNDPVTHRPRFEAFEDLFIAPRPWKKKLSPADALTFLVERGVFRTGLELTCPRCELAFWVSLDDAKTTVECEYCGRSFASAPQLKDRDWRYRRSGLFGSNDNQHGGLPVVVTLQQLETLLKMDKMLYATSLDLEPTKAPIDKCETDFVVLAGGHSHNMPHQPQVVIGECKSGGGTITRDDAVHLAKVADALPTKRVSAFIVFAKLGSFSAEEIEACALAQHRWHQRVIVLGKDELEPYHVDDRHPAREPKPHIGGLEDLASMTTQLYPSLRCKGWLEWEQRRAAERPQSQTLPVPPSTEGL
ncbi:MAG: hypothetical protein AB7N65_09980 [Vicinamibacterales bacterium]